MNEYRGLTNTGTIVVGMTKHPYFAIQPSGVISNPPIAEHIATMHTNNQSVSMSIPRLSCQYNFKSLTEVEQFYVDHLIQNSPRVEVEQLEGALGIVIQRCSNKVALATRRGIGNKVLINPAFETKFIEACNKVLGRTFEYNPTDTVNGNVLIGKLGNIDVWTCAHVPENNVIVYYKNDNTVGNMERDSSAIYIENDHGHWLSLLSGSYCPAADYAIVINM